jgi:hypothetical protein
MPFPNKLTFIFLMTSSCTDNLFDTSLVRHLTCIYNGCWLPNLPHTTIYCEYINNCPTRCNTKQSIYYSASSLYMFRVSATPITRSTQKCNYSHQYWSYFCAATFLQRSQASLTPETCRVNLQNNK